MNGHKEGQKRDSFVPLFISSIAVTGTSKYANRGGKYSGTTICKVHQQVPD